MEDFCTPVQHKVQGKADLHPDIWFAVGGIHMPSGICRHPALTLMSDTFCTSGSVGEHVAYQMLPYRPRQTLSSRTHQILVADMCVLSNSSVSLMNADLYISVHCKGNTVPPHLSHYQIHGSGQQARQGTPAFRTAAGTSSSSSSTQDYHPR